MVNFPVNSTNLRFLLPEVIWLEPEYFEQASEISNKVTGEAHQWQTYLNALALFGFEEWLSERIPEQIVNRDLNVTEATYHLQVGEFKLCLIATDNLINEVVNVPIAIDLPKFAAHFYVLLEVLEEQEQVIVRGFLRYDQLLNYQSRSNLQLPSSCYQLPLSLFDTEPNHLLFYYRYLESTAIPLPIASAEHPAMPSQKAKEKLPEYLKQTRSKLSQWLQGVFDEGWQAIDALINPEANLALSTRNTESGAKGGKLINLGMQLGSQTVALLLNVTPETEEKLGVSIQLYPTGEQRYLPPNLKLILLSKAGKTLQSVESRSQDNYIQLKFFKGEPGKRFSVEVSLNDVNIKEDFEL